MNRCKTSNLQKWKKYTFRIVVLRLLSRAPALCIKFICGSLKSVISHSAGVSAELQIFKKFKVLSGISSSTILNLFWAERFAAFAVTFGYVLPKRRPRVMGMTITFYCQCLTWEKNCRWTQLDENKILYWCPYTEPLRSL